jgi:putative DNA primase/helicase
MPDDPIFQLAEIRSRGKAHPAPSADPDEALSGTEDEVALEFSNQNAETFRYVKLWNSWLRWDGAVWQKINDLSVFHLVRKLARAASKKYQDKKLGRDAATAAIERATRNDPRHDRLPEIWDADFRQLGTPHETEDIL